MTRSDSAPVPGRTPGRSAPALWLATTRRRMQVNDHGQVLLDLFVRPKEKVTDFRTQFSGIRPKDIVAGVPHEEAMRQVHALVDGKIVVGHAVHNDIRVWARRRRCVQCAC